MKYQDISSLWPHSRQSKWMSAEFMPGLVSVVMPIYNRASRVARALDSLRSQDYRPIEIIVVDDGSTDGTGEIVENWARLNQRNDFQIWLVKQSNGGAPSARNAGLVISVGEFIHYMDSDDVLVAGKISSHVSALVSNGLDFVWSEMLLMPEARLLDLPPEGLAQAKGERFFADPNAFPDATYVGLYRRNLCRAIGPWDETLICRQDSDYRYRTEALQPPRRHISGVFYVAITHDDGRINDRYMTPEGIDSLIRSLKNADRYTQYTGVPIDLFHRNLMALRLALSCERDDLVRRAFAGLVRSAPRRAKSTQARVLSRAYALLGSKVTLSLLDTYSRLRGAGVHAS